MLLFFFNFVRKYKKNKRIGQIFSKKCVSLRRKKGDIAY